MSTQEKPHMKFHSCSSVIQCSLSANLSDVIKTLAPYFKALGKHQFGLAPTEIKYRCICDEVPKSNLGISQSRFRARGSQAGK